MSIKPFETPAKPDDNYIRTMFDGLAKRYDLFTSLIGFGQDQRMRRACIAPVRPGMRVLDLACGTGDLALMAAAKVGSEGSVVGLDFSPKMIEVAEERARKEGLDKTNLSWVVDKAEALPLEGKPFDLIVCGYALRGFYENIDEILKGIHDSLSEKGQISFLDLTQPTNPVFMLGYRFYMFVLVGLYGLLLYGKDYPVPYLPVSTNRFYRAHQFIEQLKKSGFTNVRKRSFMFGTVTLYQASR